MIWKSLNERRLDKENETVEWAKKKKSKFIRKCFENTFCLNEWNFFFQKIFSDTAFAVFQWEETSPIWIQNVKFKWQILKVVYFFKLDVILYLYIIVFFWLFLFCSLFLDTINLQMAHAKYEPRTTKAYSKNTKKMKLRKNDRWIEENACILAWLFPCGPLNDSRM